MSAERKREIASLGGRKSQQRDPTTGKLIGKGFRWTSETGKDAARKATAGRARAKARRLTKETED